MTAVLRLRLSIVCFGAAVSLVCASVSHGQVNTTPNDSWDTDGTFNSPSPVLSSSTTGATLNTHSLAAQNPSANFWGPATFNLVADPANRRGLTNATTFSYSLTLNSSDLNRGIRSFGGLRKTMNWQLLYSRIRWSLRWPQPIYPRGLQCCWSHR